MSVAWNPRIICREDGSFRELTTNRTPSWSRLGCYDTPQAAESAARFLFGPAGWVVRWSDHGWFYITPNEVKP